jgi:hypothetical protein
MSVFLRVEEGHQRASTDLTADLAMNMLCGRITVPADRTHKLLAGISSGTL